MANDDYWETSSNGSSSHGSPEKKAEKEEEGKKKKKGKDENAAEGGNSKSAKKLDLTVTVCRDFTRGRCARSQLECKYAHPTPAVAVDGETVTICYDSLRDRCARGYTCRYFHPPPHLRVKMQELAGINTAPLPLGYQANPELLQSSLYGPALMHPSPVHVPMPVPVPVIAAPKASTRALEVCREFLRGQCKRDAANCRYAHHTLSSADGEYAIVCQDFLRGRCNRDSCRFFHAPQHLRSRIIDLPVDATSENHQLNVSDSTGYNTALAMGPIYSYPANLYEQQNVKRIRLDVPSPNLHYVDPSYPYYGGGYGVPFYPVQAVPPMPPVPTVTPNPAILHPPPVPQPINSSNDEDRLPVCRDFLKQKCNRGKSCKYVHPESHIQVVDNFVTVCRDFQRGNCKRERCRFHHPITIVAAT